MYSSLYPSSPITCNSCQLTSLPIGSGHLPLSCAAKARAEEASLPSFCRYTTLQARLALLCLPVDAVGMMSIENSVLHSDVDTHVDFHGYIPCKRLSPRSELFIRHGIAMMNTAHLRVLECLLDVIDRPKRNSIGISAYLVTK